MENTFEVEEALQYGWAQTKQHFGYLVGLIILLFVASLVLNLIGAAPVIGWILALAGQVVLNIGTIHLTLALARGQKQSYKELFTTIKPFWPFLGASILVTLAVGVGLILLIVPGIMLALMLQFYSYLIVDKNMGVVDALKESARITKGHKWQLLWLMVLLIIINLIGALIFGVGLLVTIPITMMAMIHVYQKLSGATSSAPTESSPPGSPKPLEQDARAV